MTTPAMRLALGIAAVTTLLFGCAPAVLRSEGPLSPITPSAAAAGAGTGERVRWGGVIAATNPQQNETCFDVISKPLDSRYRPRDTDETMGRFRTCAPGFYDPGIYEPARSLTVVGTLRGVVPAQVGDFTLNYPLVAADAVYLWRPRTEKVYYPYPYYWFGYPYPYFNYYPYWGFHRHYHRRH
jgi:outer membrane lipoprotein